MADVEDIAEAVEAAEQRESQWGKGKMISFQCVMGRCRRRPAWYCCAQAATNSHREHVRHAMCNSSKTDVPDGYCGSDGGTIWSSKVHAGARADLK